MTPGRRWTIMLSAATTVIGFAGSAVMRHFQIPRPEVIQVVGLLGVFGFVVLFFSTLIISVSDLIEKIGGESEIPFYRWLYGAGERKDGKD